jgi:integrase
MRADLNDALLRSIKPPPPGQRLTIWDTRQPLLVLRMTATGVATWSVRARTAHGKRTQPTLGRWPQMGIAAARKRAIAVLAEIHAGGDPVQERRDAELARQARLGQPTVTSRLGQWQEARRDQWSVRHADQIRRMCLNEIIPHIGDRPLAETSRSDWTEIVARKRRTSPSSAAALYRLVSAFAGHAEASGWIDHALLPRKGAAVLAPAVEARERVLTDDELAAIWQAADGMQPKARAFVHLLAMTAARRQEVADIATGEIDLERGTWTISASRAKNGVAYTIPLHLLLIADLKVIWPEQDADPSWRLLGQIKGSGLSGFSKIKSRLEELSGVRNWHIHDLRRSARTGMARLGVSDRDAEAAINHISGQSQLIRAYNRHDYRGEIIAALTRWQAYVASLLQPQSSAAEIAPFRASA